MTIPQAARSALADAPEGLTPDQILDRIQAGGLYTFKAASPRSVLLSALKRHAINTHHCDPAKDKLFERLDDGRYRLAASSPPPE